LIHQNLAEDIQLSSFKTVNYCCSCMFNL